MLDILVGTLASVVNIAVGFLSDGAWKTAGNSVAQFCWQLADRGK